MKFISTILAASLIPLLAAPAQAANYTVKMVTSGDKGSYYFDPKQLTIHSGDTVTWLNTEDDTHNVMAETVPAGAESFMSPMLEGKGKKWSYTFTKPGTYSYHCHPHAANGMQATIIVDHPSEKSDTKEVVHHNDHH